MNVYLAGSFADRPRLRGYRADLETLGFTCTSTWLDTPDDLRDADLTPDELRECAKRDLDDLYAADALILFTDVPSTSGGMHVEMGYAMGAVLPVMGVGPRTNIFHHLIAESDWFATWADCLASLERRHAA